MSIQTNLFGEKSVRILDSLPPIDIYMSGRFNGSRACCCIAKEFGFKMGVRSDCIQYRCKNCRIDFIDNEFLKYNHNEHYDLVMKLKPKTATLRDYFNKEQCKSLNVEYYPLNILQEHGNDFIKNGITPIIIPKYDDALKEIEEMENFNKYVVGAMFAGKWGAVKKIPVKVLVDHGYKIHLLGGDPSNQIRMYAKYPENIVSMDSAVIPQYITSKQIWIPKRFNNRNQFNINKSTPFPRPGYASASLCASMSFTNLYEFIVTICNGVI